MRKLVEHTRALLRAFRANKGHVLGKKQWEKFLNLAEIKLRM